MAKKILRLSFSQQLAIHNLLIQHCIKRDDGFAQYENGWDDQEIASKMEFPCSHTSVAHIRCSELGQLEKGGSSKFNIDQDKRIAALEKTVERLNEVVFKLCADLNVEPSNDV